MSTYAKYASSTGDGGGAVDSVNGQVGVVVLTPADLGLGPTDDVTFGSVTANNLTPNTALIANSSKEVVSSVTTDTELAFVHGVTSNIQTQLNGKQPTLTIGNLTDVGTDGIVITGGTGAVIGSGTQLAQHVADSTHNGYLSSSDWSTFNNKLDADTFNYITNPDAEVDLSGWNLYNNTGRTVPAYLVDQDITYTSTLSGNGGNGVDIEYIYNASFSSSTPNINVISSTHVQVRWNNGPTVANNPTATQLVAAWNAVPAATAIATVAITGTASRLQFINGQKFLGNGGDSSPTDGTGGVSSGVTLTRNTATPLIGVASFDLGKIAANEQGQGVSTDFTINAVDKNSVLQVTFDYQASSGMVLGTNSDVRVFIYDIGNAVLIPVTPLNTLSGTTGSPHDFVGVFNTSSSSNYRLILHIATTSAVAWDLLFDGVTVNDEITPGEATEVPSLVLQQQPISGAVTDHMVVMWRDGATQWVPATIAGAAIPAFGTDKTQLGFATNILGATADIFIRGYMNGFSFGPFAGFDQYIDNTAGSISPLPSPFTDTYVIVGMAISATELNIQFDVHVDLISNAAGTPLKGGLLTNSAINDGTGDQVLTVGANGNVPVANSAASLGIQWLPAVVAAAPFTYTLATRTLTIATATNSVSGILSASDHTTFAAAAPLNSPAFTGTPSLPTGTTGVTQTAGNSTTALATTAFVTTADNLKANLASPTFTGTPTLPTGTIGVTQTAGNSTTALATTAFVTTADNLKAPLASPVFTGDVNVSTGNLLVSTIGKGLQVKTGTNSKIGTAVLVAGTVTVANTSVTSNSRIFVTSQVDGGVTGFLRITAKTVGTSFVITSSVATDTSTVAWLIVESIP